MTCFVTIPLCMATMYTRKYGRPVMANCERETGNTFDPFAVCVKKHDDIVGHMPRKFLPYVFLRRGRRILTSTRQYSHDIPHAGWTGKTGALMLALDYPDRSHIEYNCIVRQSW